MTGKRKWFAIALLAVVLLGVAALAAGLPGMRLQDGRPFRLPASDEQAAEALGGDSAFQRGFVLARGLIAAAVIIYAIYIFVSLLTRQGRKRLFNDLIRLAVFVLCLYLLNTRGAELFNNFKLGGNLGGLGQATTDPSVPLALFSPSTPGWIPLGLLLAAATLLAAFVGVIAWWWFMPTRRGAAKADAARQLLSAEARQAVQDIEAGEQLEDVVLRAYYRMERILAEQRGLSRAEAMTPSEFADALGRQGLPKGAVNDLTHLFEAVRYGGKQLGPESQQRATNALRAITLTLPDQKVSYG
jgi:hypothetical protein